MDLIYADKNGIEIGVIQEYTFDTAFGIEENDFSITIDINEHCCNDGDSLYIEGTEYGGKIDKIIPDTKSDSVTYEGRTWHGIIESKIIEPDEGQDYKIVSGEANHVLSSLINDIGLSDTFLVSTDDSGIVICKYQFERYCKAYTGILDMLFSFRAKLKLKHENGIVKLSVIPLYDYSKDEEWDSSQFDFSIEKNYRPVNHLICLGGGDLKNRNVIHIFTDKNGGVLPYCNISNPVSDEDYILDKSKQILSGIDEVTDTYDYGNAATTENYILTTSQPDNWSRTYTDFYYKSDDKYVQNEKSYQIEYSLITSEPSDWNSNYGRYFLKNGDSFKNVEGEENTSYKIQNSQPSDWNSNYKNYFYYYSDGTTVEYKSVSSEKFTEYNLQTMQPSDWNSNYSNYYYAIPTVVFEYKVSEEGSNGIWSTHTEILSDQEQAVNTSKKKYCSCIKAVSSWKYEKISGDTAPVWEVNKYYTAKSIDAAPSWESEKYYTAIHSSAAPLWSSDKYYKEDTVEDIPAWINGKYYRLFKDNYADLVSGGLKRLKELNNSDSIGISLDASQEYDLNDIVGARENITGISASKKITKKIVKIKNGIIEINYEIGE